MPQSVPSPAVQQAAPPPPSGQRGSGGSVPLRMQGPQAAGASGSLRITPAAVVAGGVLAAAFVGLFHHWFYKQHLLSLSRPADWAHSYFVPLISGYIAWQHRERLAAAAVRVFWPGLAPMTLGIAAYAFFAVGYVNHMAQGWSMILTLYGLLLLLLGPGVMRYLTLPVAYLVFAVTISDMLMIALTAKLQLIASHGSYVMLSVLGITADLQGVTLTVFDSQGNALPLNVAEACSGMRQLIAFMALGAAVALVACRHWWQRVALLLLAPPVAIFINIVRVGVLGLLSLWDPEWGAGEAHTFVGTVLLIPAFLLYMGLVWTLKRVVREEPEAAPAAAAAAGGGA